MYGNFVRSIVGSSLQWHLYFSLLCGRALMTGCCESCSGCASCCLTSCKSWSKCTSMKSEGHPFSNTLLFGVWTKRICTPCDFTIRLFHLCKVGSRNNGLIRAKRTRHWTSRHNTMYQTISIGHKFASANTCIKQNEPDQALKTHFRYDINDVAHH